MTPALTLDRLLRGEAVTGRHVVVVAHPDDEAISFGGALSLMTDAVIVQLTADGPEREAERSAAQVAAGWQIPVLYGDVRFRHAYESPGWLRGLMRVALDEAVAVWTHPYEGGHLDHDMAAWLVQQTAGLLPRFEFASYHATETGQVFGDFWPDAMSPATSVILNGDRLDRKRAALAAYRSQAHIVRKFPHPERECYRVAPRYDFSHPPPPPRARWDVKGYQPSTAVWRQTLREAA